MARSRQIGEFPPLESVDAIRAQPWSAQVAKRVESSLASAVAGSPHTVASMLEEADRPHWCRRADGVDLDIRPRRARSSPTVCCATSYRKAMIDEVVMPESVGGPGWRLFEEYAAVRNAVEAHTLGTALMSPGAAELLSEYQSNPHRMRRHFIARDGAEVLGRGMVVWRPHTPETGAYLMVDVLPGSRGKGLGTALAEVVEQVAVEVGAPVLKAALPHAASPGAERLAPPTGFGDVSANDPGVRFLHARGFALEQVTRISLLEVAGLTQRLDLLEASAAATAGADYRLISWTGPTPETWVDDLAELRSRMSTDAPSGGMVMVADPWGAARVREHDERMAGSGRQVITAAAEHTPSGRLAGYSEIVVSDERPVAVQEDTLVLREHRGHRLGMLLKLAAAERLRQARPSVEAIVTWNAEENRPMLDVNEAMGFRALGQEGAWQRRV
ncbi:GNAT family N-acetyltransferase [Aeromicrobium sp. UC242_57]|uniref:GNAT family N-acetyltransferase n=1 Tax=Aeromicrobium sp. UC242_57 TaxID=3374624 RepID=UPI0037A6E3C8